MDKSRDKRLRRSISDWLRVAMWVSLADIQKYTICPCNLRLSDISRWFSSSVSRRKYSASGTRRQWNPRWAWSRAEAKRRSRSNFRLKISTFLIFSPHFPYWWFRCLSDSLSFPHNDGLTDQFVWKSVDIHTSYSLKLRKNLEPEIDEGINLCDCSVTLWSKFNVRWRQLRNVT